MQKLLFMFLLKSWACVGGIFGGEEFKSLLGTYGVVEVGTELWRWAEVFVGASCFVYIDVDHPCSICGYTCGDVWIEISMEQTVRWSAACKVNTLMNSNLMDIKSASLGKESRKLNSDCSHLSQPPSLFTFLTFSFFHFMVNDQKTSRKWIDCV